ncbi:MAG: cytochrome c-type biogenesis protein [Pseudomonadota bacterium]
MRTDSAPGPHALLRCAAAVIGAMLAMAAFAVIETYEFSSPELERRYHQLSQELRCPKCQNQNIADSNAPISQDLRQLLYKRLEEGASNDEILADMVARYGEFVRYRPAARGVALWLWLAPLLLLVFGAALLLVLLRRGREPADAVNPEDLERLDALLAASTPATGAHKDKRR